MSQFDIYQTITDEIIEGLEQSVADGSWQCPWHRSNADGVPRNAVKGNHYNGINVLYLWLIALKNGWTNQWATRKQFKTAGCTILDGERHSMCLYYFPVEKDVEDEDGETTTKTWMYPRYHQVFNVSQVSGWEQYEPDPSDAEDVILSLDNIDEMIDGLNADIRIGGQRAFYRPSEDFVAMPDRWRFQDERATEHWYSTLLHELTHWTKQSHRCDRKPYKPAKNMPAKAAYAFEELVAELGSTFLCMELGIEPEVRNDHKQYLASWLQALKNDKNFIIRASKQAAIACQFIKAPLDQQIKKAA